MGVRLSPRAPMKNLDKNTLAYVTGLAIGDGNLSNPNGRATRLRITCDTKYQNLIKEICTSIQKVLPENKVLIIKRAKTFWDVSCYSNKWEGWLGWQAKGGSKYNQNVSIPDWIQTKEKYKINCLRGLLQTDGTIYLDRKYKAVMFTTIIYDLAHQVLNMIKELGFNPHLYEIKSKDKKTRYNIRISKNVDKFIKKIQFVKN
ncbi:MAG: LAGLIDADG family homing endonuclease [Patescibacteria group bacterium]